jgi:FKBP-type peptidyl-prolyl cis-trans isomerase FklB
MKKMLVKVLAVAVALVAVTSCQHKYTAKMENTADTLSYALGVTQSSGLVPFLQESFSVDSTQLDDVIKGITNVAQAKSDNEKAKLMGVSLGIQLKKSVIEALNYRLFSNDSTKRLNEALFFETFNKVARGESMGMDAMEANYYANLTARRIVIDTLEVTPAICDSLSMAYAIANAEGFSGYLQETAGFDSVQVLSVLDAIEETVALTSSNDLARSVGVNIGMQVVDNIFPMIEKEFFADSADFNKDNFFAAFFASMRGEDLLLDEMEAGAIMRREGEKIYESKMEANYGENKAAGLAFLEANKAVEGVKVTPSGLQYLVLKEGKGANPTATSVVKVHYHGTLIDGTVFDSSVNRGTPAEFPLNQVIAGWTEGLQLMNKGAKYRFFIPQELGYGGQDRGVIKPFSVLIFDVELLDIVK